MRATATIVPLTAAQVSASRISTSGEAGLAGGGLPVAACQEAFNAFRAAVAASNAETSENAPQSFELSLWPGSLDIVASRSGSPRLRSSLVPGHRAAMRQALS